LRLASRDLYSGSGLTANWINLPNASGLYIGLQLFFLFASPSALL